MPQPIAVLAEQCWRILWCDAPRPWILLTARSKVPLLALCRFIMSEAASRCVTEIELLRTKDAGSDTPWISTIYRYCCRETSVAGWSGEPPLETLVGALLNRPCPRCGRVPAIKLYVDHDINSKVPEVLRERFVRCGIELVLRHPGVPTCADEAITRMLQAQPASAPGTGTAPDKQSREST